MPGTQPQVTPSMEFSTTLRQWEGVSEDIEI